MKKRISSLALFAVLGLSAATTLQAETMGTNPRPRPSPRFVEVLQVMSDVVFAYIGI